MDDAAFMRRAIELAMRGRGRVEPNPMVGCVIVKDGQILAEGSHEFFGGPHAEINALAACENALGATAYASLEPCCVFTNKKTPPCTNALIAAKVARVVAACQDPNPSIHGGGFEQLRDAGIAVEDGLLAGEARQLNAAFFKAMQFSRPYVTLKWAQTADGKIAGAGGRRLAISNSTSLRAVHQLRSRCDAILVGIGTVLMDDPLLTARVPNPPRIPLRIVLDSSLRIGLDRQLVKSAARVPLVVCCRESAYLGKQDLVARLQDAGAEVLVLPDDGNQRISLDALLDELGRRGMAHLCVEPGVRLAESFLRGNYADRVWITKSPKLANADDAPQAAKVEYPVSGKVMLVGDELTEYLNPQSPVFFLLQPSADLNLAGD